MDALRALPVLRRGIIADGVGLEGAHVVDINGDGRPDLVTCAAGAPFVLEYRNGAYRPYWQGPTTNCSGIAVGDRDGDGGLEIFVGTSTGSLLVFDPRSSGPPVARVTVPSPGANAVQDVVAGNVDGDAALEIIVVTSAATHVYDAATLSVTWSAEGYGGTKAGIGEIDGDPNREIVVTGSSGSVLDATTQTLEWGYAGGFGRSMILGNADADARDEIVFTSQWEESVTILNGDTFATSSIALDWYVDTIGLGDSNGDGVNEVLVGDNQWGSVTSYEIDTASELWSVPNPEHGVHFIVLADMDLDGVTEVLWGAGWTSSGEDGLFIANPQNSVIEFTSVDLDGPFHTAACDLDATGRLEWIVATARTNSGYSAGLVTVVDFPSGVERASFTGVSPHTWGDIIDVAAGQLDSDPAREIVVYGGALRAIDGVTGTTEWTSGGSFTGRKVLVMNLDADPVDEIVGATTDGKIVVLNGASNIIQASRVFTGSIVDLAIADTDGTGTPELLVATGSQLMILALPSLSLRTDISVSSIVRVAGSPVGGGTVAVAFGNSPRLRTFAASDLSARWSCSTFTSTDAFTAMTFADIAGTTRLLTIDATGLLRAFRFDGADCEVAGTAMLSTGVQELTMLDITEDGRLDLLTDGFGSAEVVLLGLPSEPRGEVTGDAMLTGADAERITDYVFGKVNGLAAGGDVNADGRIAPEDVFALVHHLFDGGPAPQP